MSVSIIGVLSTENSSEKAYVHHNLETHCNSKESYTYITYILLSRSITSFIHTDPLRLCKNPQHAHIDNYALAYRYYAMNELMDPVVIIRHKLYIALFGITVSYKIRNELMDTSCNSSCSSYTYFTYCKLYGNI